ncbi:MAG: glycosyltransferase family 1 protein, partial [Bacteroidaceae bacterium]|nr:glycosyltransferase family 1 protein [Bacteroidaceae bacterium]
MKIGFDAKRLFNNFTGLGNHSRTTIDILTAAFPEHEYWLYTPKVKESEVTLPYMGKKGCNIVKPDGLLKGSAWRTYGLAKDIKRDGIEVFHGLSNEMPVGLHRLGIGSVVTIHD